MHVPAFSPHEALGEKCRRYSRSGDYAHDVGLLHDQEILSFELDLGARPLAEQHPVAGLHVGFDNLAALVAATGPNGYHFSLGRLFLCGIGDDDAALGFFLGIDTLDDHAVVQGTKLGFGHMILAGANALNLSRGSMWGAVSTHVKRVPKAGPDIGAGTCAVKARR